MHSLLYVVFLRLIRTMISKKYKGSVKTTMVIIE